MYLCEGSHALVDIHLDCSKSALGEIEPKTSRGNQGMRPWQQKVDSYRQRRMDVSVGWVGQAGSFLGGRRGFANIVCLVTPGEGDCSTEPGTTTMLLLLFGAMIAVRFGCSKRVWDNEYRGGKRAQRVSYSYEGGEREAEVGGQRLSMASDNWVQGTRKSRGNED